MAADGGALSTLENLMNEFFNPLTSNEKKREIELCLNTFSQQSEAWRHTMYFLTNTSNQYVMMFATTLLENIVNKRWVGVTGADKLSIRSTVYNYLMEYHTRVPTFIRNKICKLIVDIARIDWPHFYPDFFTNILQLLQSGSQSVLGLTLLQTTSEELISSREDLSAARKQELKKLLLDQMPGVLSIIAAQLENLFDHSLQSSTTATPPPSPTHTDKFNKTNEFDSGSLLSKIFSSPVKNQFHTQSAPNLDVEGDQLATAALQCLSQLFSWMPLNHTITPVLMRPIFRIAALGCEPTKTPSIMNSGLEPSTRTKSRLGILAMSCINEIMSKNCVPVDVEEYLLHIFQQTFYLLQKLTNVTGLSYTGGSSGGSCPITDIDEGYLDKFTEFLRLFVSVHLRRFEVNNQFPMLDLLGLLFKYTFKQPSFDGYYHCLEIWTVFLDFLQMTKENRGNSDTNNSYKEALLSLLSEICHKMQFRHNQNQLEELDDEICDDDGETEWQIFLRNSLEVIAQIAVLLPEDSLSIFLQLYQECSSVYMDLGQFVMESTVGRKLTVTGESECRKLHCTLRDLATVLRALGRLSDLFICEHFPSRFSLGQDIMARMCELAVFGTEMRFYEIQTSAETVLKPDFIDVHAQVLAGTQSYNQWLLQYVMIGKSHDKIYSIVSSIASALTPLLGKNVPHKIALSAAHLLVSIATTVRPLFMLQLVPMQMLYTHVSRGALNSLTIEIQLLTIRALSNILILPWPSVSEGAQDWDNRGANHVTFIRHLLTDFDKISRDSLVADKTLQERMKPVIKKTVVILNDLVDSIDTEVNRTKQLCYTSIEKCVHTLLDILPVFILYPDVMEDMLIFFLTLFKSLQVQLGVEFMQQVLDTFLNLFTPDQLAESLISEGSAGCAVVEKFLQILTVVVQQPDQRFKSFLPNIISLSVDKIYPILAQRRSSDVKPVLYNLCYEILNHNWRYFFRGNVLQSFQTESSENINHQAEFISIMQAFGQSFMQSDLQLFRQNLDSLEKINTKWKLYHKMIFREMMLFQFLNVLIQALVQRSFDTAKDEIVQTVYSMASVDLDAFFHNFFPQFLQSCGLLDMHQKTMLATNFKYDQDMPSFTRNLESFVGDLRYYQLCNSSLSNSNSPVKS